MTSTPDTAPRYNMAFLWLVCLVAAMGGLLFGYDWVVVGGAKAFYEPFFGISGRDDLTSLAMSSALFGCLMGAVCSGFLSDRLGRKRLLIFSGFLFTYSAIWTAMCGSFSTFITARIVGGIGIGLASNLSPMYIAEISPAHVRGRLVSINQLTIVIGVLLAQVTNLMIARPVPKIDEIRLLINDQTAAAVAADEKEFDLEAEKLAAAEVVDWQAVEDVKKLFDEESGRMTLGGKPIDKEKENRLIMDAYLQATWNGQAGWRWMFAAETIPALLFFLMMFCVPESPRWLVKNGQSEKAGRILAKVGGEKYAAAEVDDIRSTIAQEEVAKVRFRDLLEPKVKLLWGMGVILAVFQQWCGINVIFNYAQEVFRAAGYEVRELMFTIVITGIVNLVFTFVAIFTVDKIGRKPLMLFGAAGLAGIYVLLGTGFYLESKGVHMLVLVVLAIACYAMSLAPVTWVVISEIFPNRIRGAAMSIAVSALWAGCLALTITFPFLESGLGAHGAFWLYAAICVMGFVYIFTHLPETKGKSLEDIERELVD
jgi:SP family arabinose:H+ symporter-like MFS transporter